MVSNVLLAVAVLIFLILVYRLITRGSIFSPKSKAKGIMRFAERGDLDQLRRELTKKDESVHKRDDNNWTLLHWAVHNGQMDTAEYLIKNGADINAVDDTGCTALHITARQIRREILLGQNVEFDFHIAVRDRLDIARLLIEHGADKDLVNRDNRTAVDLALSTPMKILLQIPLFQTRRAVQQVKEV